MIRPLLLLALCFYTHIGVPWFLALSVFLYGLLDRRYRQSCFFVFISALLLASPVILKQLFALRLISIEAIPERYFCEFKTVDYLFALFGLTLLFRKDKKYRIFFSFFLAGFIFLAYPYRFFSAEGFLSIILLSAVALDFICDKLYNRNLMYLFIIILGYVLFFSPTVVLDRAEKDGRVSLKTYIFDSALDNMVFPGRNERLGLTTLWFPREYLPLVEIIRQHSRGDDIIYSPLHNIGVCLGAISGRATACALFPEIGPSQEANPFQVSKIVVFPRDVDLGRIESIVNKYNLARIGENKLFIVYKNPLCQVKSLVEKSALPFYAIALILAVFLLLFWQAQKFELILGQRLAVFNPQKVQNSRIKD